MAGGNGNELVTKKKLDDQQMRNSQAVMSVEANMTMQQQANQQFVPIENLMETQNANQVHIEHEQPKELNLELVQQEQIPQDNIVMPTTLSQSGALNAEKVIKDGQLDEDMHEVIQQQEEVLKEEEKQTEVVEEKTEIKQQDEQPLEEEPQEEEQLSLEEQEKNLKESRAELKLRIEANRKINTNLMNIKNSLQSVRKQLTQLKSDDQLQEERASLESQAAQLETEMENIQAQQKAQQQEVENQEQKVESQRQKLKAQRKKELLQQYANMMQKITEDKDSTSKEFSAFKDAMAAVAQQLADNSEANDMERGESIYTLYDAAMQYYNTHRGYRWSSKGKRRKKMILDIINVVHQTMAYEGLDDTIRYVAYEKLLENPGEKGWKNRHAREFLRNQARKEADGWNAVDENTYRFKSLVTIRNGRFEMLNKQLNAHQRLHATNHMDERVMMQPSLFYYYDQKTGEPLTKLDAEKKALAEKKLNWYTSDDFEVRKHFVDDWVDAMLKWEFHPDMLSEEWIIDHYHELFGMIPVNNHFNDNIDKNEDNNAYYRSMPKSVVEKVEKKRKLLEQVLFYRNSIEVKYHINPISGEVKTKDRESSLELEDVVKQDMMSAQVNDLYQRYWKGEPIEYKEVLRLIDLYQVNQFVAGPVYSKLHILKAELEAGDDSALAKEERKKTQKGFEEICLADAKRYRNMTRQKYQDLPPLPDEAFFNASHLDEMKRLIDERKKQTGDIEKAVNTKQKELTQAQVDLETAIAVYKVEEKLGINDEESHKEEVSSLKENIKTKKQELEDLKNDLKQKKIDNKEKEWQKEFDAYVRMVSEHAILSTKTTALAHKGFHGLISRNQDENGNILYEKSGIYKDRELLQAKAKEQRELEVPMLARIKEQYNKLCRMVGLTEVKTLEAELLLQDQRSKGNHNLADFYARQQSKYQLGAGAADKLMLSDEFNKRLDVVYARYQKCVNIKTNINRTWIGFFRTENPVSGLSEEELQRNREYNDRLMLQMEALFYKDEQGEDQIYPEKVAKLYEDQIDILLAMDPAYLLGDYVKRAVEGGEACQDAEEIQMMFTLSDANQWGNLVNDMKKYIPADKLELMQAYGLAHVRTAALKHLVTSGYLAEGGINPGATEVSVTYEMKIFLKEEVRPHIDDVFKIREKILERQRKEQKNNGAAS